jgi:hypothetical protein
MTSCKHNQQNSVFWDVFMLLMIFAGAIVLREVLCWFLKTNHILAELQSLRQVRTGHLIHHA